MAQSAPCFSFFAVAIEMSETSRYRHRRRRRQCPYRGPARHRAGARSSQVAAAVELLDDGATVPFIARYRKEATGGLDDTVLRNLEVRLGYLRELEGAAAADPRIDLAAGHLTPELQQEIASADTKQRLEDLYAPYKPKRRTRAQIAREAGLEPLADAILADPACDPAAGRAVPESRSLVKRRAPRRHWMARATSWRNATPKCRPAGRHARTSLVHRLSVFQDGRGQGNRRRQLPRLSSTSTSRCARCHLIASWRCCAAASKACWTSALGPGKRTRSTTAAPCARMANCELGRPVRARCLAAFALARRSMPLDLARQAGDGVRRTDRPPAETAEAEAIRVFAANLKDLLLAAPAGKAMLGLDPGIRTGCKVAVIDRTGKVVDTTTVYPFEPRRDREGTINTLAALVARHKVDLITIGNGTASRESEKLVSDMQERFPDLKVTRVVVSEAGASVYSASRPPRRVPRYRRDAARRRVDRAACRIRWPNWSRSIPRPSAAIKPISTRRQPARAGLAFAWMRWSRTA